MPAGFEMEIPPEARLEQSIKKLGEMLGIVVDLAKPQFEQALGLSVGVSLVIKLEDGKLTVTLESSDPASEDRFTKALREHL